MVKKGGGILVKKGGAVRQLTTQPFNQVTIKQLVYHLTDHLTGTNIDTDEQGNVLEAVDYYPFGGVRVDEKSGGYENKYKYTGKELDADTGLYYYGARYYDAGIGRFVSEDPIALFNPEQFLFDPQQLNFYSYGRNNPVLYNDPNGCGAREFAAGFSNAYYTNYTFGFGRNNSSDSSYRMGQALGDGMSLFQGLAEMASGILLAGGGTIISGTGVGVAVGVPSVAAGATMVAHGSTLAGSSINNTIKKESKNNTSGSSKNKSSTPSRGLAPDGVKPPVPDPDNLKIKPASRPSEAGKGGKSYWDSKGGEWRYFPGDNYHNPHWDYNPQQSGKIDGLPGNQWRNIQIGDKPAVKPLKNNP